MDNKFKFKIAVGAYVSVATYLMFLISDEMFLACITSAVAAFLFCSAIQYHSLLSGQKKRRKHNINFNSNRFYKYRFLFWFNIAMYMVLVIKVTEIIYLIEATDAR